MKLTARCTVGRSSISYDGLGGVVAREQGNSNGSNVEEFRNDAFGNMIRKMNRRSAGLINTAPFTLSYNVTGALTSWNTTITASSGHYDRNDDLTQEFSSGRLIRQNEIIRNPSTGDVSLELAARHYYGADDRLMAVERYSYRSSAFQDGTWEEYWYDALGRRVLTRTRREPTSPYDATVSGPLCVSSTAPVCRSFTERVWWDGDQSLVEERTPEGTSDVSNSGTVGNIHALTLDEPLAVITTSPSAETRIINYNWRGQGMGSVYPSGHGADVSTGFAIAEIDWPAVSQAETYFTPSLDAAATDNNPKKWLGTFIQNGMGTTGMLYRRNRYFDTNTGRFTQEDPIGIAGGVNQYGFANGDPVNFSDPFGLLALDDIYFNEYGNEIKRVTKPGPDRNFLILKDETYNLDYGLVPGATPYSISKDPSMFDAQAKALAMETAPGYSNLLSIGMHSLPNGTLDFKRLLPDRSLFNSGNGFYTHKHAVGNAAWGFYMKKHGYSLEIALKGAMGQGSTVGGEDLLDQRMIKRGYRIKQ